MMNKLDLDSMETRRKVKKLKLLHSILSQKTFLPNGVTPSRARDKFKLKPIHARVQSFAALFIQSATSEWNKLSSVLLRENNIKTFEEGVYKFYRD